MRKLWLMVMVAVAVVGLVLAFLPAGAEKAVGCQAVPPEYMKMKNPVSLDEDLARYYQKQFLTKCARCHGEDGAGGSPEDQAQQYPPANFTSSGFMANCTDGQLFYQIENGGEGRGDMPAFGKGSAVGWSEEKMWGMVSYLRTIAGMAR
ncbi:MAG: c-type cytochrome [Deltaproteobacteria bacterium]|nr:c-type cytochrome [Deltaproteobacteria bacterium]